MDCVKKDANQTNVLADRNWGIGSACYDQDSCAYKSDLTGHLKEEGQKMTDVNDVIKTLDVPKDVASFEGFRENPGRARANFTVMRVFGRFVLEKVDVSNNKKTFSNGMLLQK